MTREEAAEIVLAGYKENCPWCDGIGEWREPDGSGAGCVVCFGYGFLVRDEWFMAQRILNIELRTLPSRLVSEAHKIYDLALSKKLRNMIK